MAKIKKIKGREILDSRGNPTVAAEVYLDNGLMAEASVPSGASTGEHEAWELRDGDKNRYSGLGVLKAVENIEKKIAPKLEGINITEQKEIDEKMIALDGTKNKKKLGANAILAVSLACARTGALTSKKELYKYLAEKYDFSTKYKLPIPAFNIFNGGKHADTNLDFQEFLIIPQQKKSQKSFADMVRMGSEIFHELGRVLHQAGLDADVGNEGGYAPDIFSTIQALELIMAAIINSGYKPGVDVGLGTDVGSSELYDPQKKEYIFQLDNSHFVSSTLVGLYETWLKKYPIVSIEDGLAEDDWKGWKELTEVLSKKMLLIGDDLFVTNVDRFRKGLKEKVANSILIKPNQVGTLTETMNCIKLAQRHNYKIMVSHRSGETCDSFIADLAVATGADYIKAGSLSRSERLVKYNRLMKIEKILQEKDDKKE